MIDPDDSPTPDALTDTDDHGRVGYGQYAKWSPILLVVVMAVAIGYIALNRPEGNTIGRDLVGQPAPALDFTYTDGTAESLQAMQGNVVVLNFWASWCEPCAREMPAFQAVNAQNVPATRIIGVNLKYDPNTADVAALLQSTGVTYPIVKDSGGSTQTDGEIAEAFGVSSYPTSVFIRPDGTIDSIHVGEMTQDQIEKAISAAKSG